MVQLQIIISRFAKTAAKRNQSRRDRVTADGAEIRTRAEIIENMADEM